MINTLRLKLIHMKEQRNLPLLSGEVEDKTAQVKSDIAFFKLRHSDLYPEKSSTLPQSHEHKVESTHSVEPSLDPFERLRANPSFRNAART